ncbi:hypothetical protein GCM10012275_21380 [Longimycelium tulufanense]|uniref:DNA-binding transcriptional regulator of glucitol operon n=2 Tax=Longimycelium tulufanense TaxID=907463 RepID=A0A8J3FUF8_9PSEU|nr:hypothetical protein GCM10012275_21380 [Longimycelium tulufanense]
MHALLVVAVVTCLALGWWQWERARSAGGTLQNYGYALQWPTFAAFFVFMWVRLMRLELRQLDGEEPDGAEPATGSAPTVSAASAGGAVRVRRPARPAPPRDEEPDDELAAYNRYLAELNARAEREQR